MNDDFLWEFHEHLVKQGIIGDDIEFWWKKTKGNKILSKQGKIFRYQGYYAPQKTALKTISEI